MSAPRGAKRRRRWNLPGGLLLLATGWAHAGTVHYYYTDPQGTVLAKADAQGHILATYDYAPYGSQALGTPPDGPGYTGHVNDPESGLVYMQARYYDPAVGRFLSVDPMGIGGGIFGFNRFSYVNNNPIVNIDPDGRCSGSNIHDNAGNCADSGTSITNSGPSSGGVSLSQKNNASSRGTYAPITDSERSNTDNGDLAGFWRNRNNQKDPWAVDGLALWDSTNKVLSTYDRALGAFNIFRLTNALWERDSFEHPRNSYGKEINQIGMQIARAYILTVDNNGGYVPSLSQSAAFHYNIFQSHNLPSGTYGGTPFGYSASGAGFFFGNMQARYINFRFKYCTPGCVP